MKKTMRIRRASSAAAIYSPKNTIGIVRIWERMTTTMPAIPKCATCPKYLTPTDIQRRCLRCKPCRMAKKTPPQSRFVINAEKNAIREGFIKPRDPEPTSWWMGLSRQRLQEEAVQRFDKNKAKPPLLMSTNPTGVTT